MSRVNPHIYDTPDWDKFEAETVALRARAWQVARLAAMLIPRREGIPDSFNVGNAIVTARALLTAAEQQEGV